MAKATVAPVPKKLNIYVVTTKFIGKSDTDHENHERVDYVRAKTLAGAKATIADQYVTAKLATQEDLIKLAKVAVVGEAGE